MNSAPSNAANPLSVRRALLLAAGAIVSFHLAYLFDVCGLLIAIYLYCLYRLANLRTPRLAFYFGFTIGLAVYSPHLAFFWKIFGNGAIALWCILSLWLGLFLLIGRACRAQFGRIAWAAAAAFLWTGLEYFRSELYYLRFSWLNAGYVFSRWEGLHYFATFGTYGIGFLLMAWVAYLSVCRTLPRTLSIASAIILAGISLAPAILSRGPSSSSTFLNVAGVQLEGATESQTRLALDGAIKNFPQTELFVLSEYGFLGPVPQSIRKWCQQHQRWLIVGAEEPVASTTYYNTVFVVGPDGGNAFQQGKCVPVQFMKDGLPAREQHVWNSPWGKIGLGICYDASYTRVTDELVRQGAQALILPTMDDLEWGSYEHDLHARIAPMRAAEYAVPVVRLCSSGISQIIQPDGHVAASSPYPGQGTLIAGRIELKEKGRMPPDRAVGRVSVAVAILLIAWLLIDLVSRRGKKPQFAL